ncbi:MAG TPA: DUF1844 domain-containing protein [Desulfobacteraceae bacterium]|nr:DUF1844 domain-containing protein [Desulfobacteraceae bacterium]
MAEEEKGFIIKDKRSLDEKGDLKKENQETEKIQEESKEKTRDDKAGRPPLPEVNFNSLIFSLSSSAFFHLGEIADPQTGKKEKDLPLAKHAIDTIDLLKQKTEGNLTEDEQKFINSILDDLKWRYVKAAK